MEHIVNVSAIERGEPIELGSARQWALDLSLVGALTALGVGLFSSVSWLPLTVTSALAALFGAGLGFGVPRLLHREVRRVPVLILLAAGVGLGACWGAAAGLAAAVLTGTNWIRGTELLATACAVQLGWLWLPTLVGRASGRSVWPLVVLACLASPVVGWLAMQHLAW